MRTPLPGLFGSCHLVPTPFLFGLLTQEEGNLSVTFLGTLHFEAPILEIAFPTPFAAALTPEPMPVSVKPRKASFATARALSYPLAWSLNSAHPIPLFPQL